MQPPAYRNKRCLYQKHQPPQHGIDTNVVERSFDIIAQDFTQGIIKFQVNTAWNGGTKSATRVESWELGGQTLKDAIAQVKLQLKCSFSSWSFHAEVLLQSNLC